MDTILVVALVMHLGLITVNVIVASMKNLPGSVGVFLLSLVASPLVYLFVLAAPTFRAPTKTA